MSTGDDAVPRKIRGVWHRIMDAVTGQVRDELMAVMPEYPEEVMGVLERQQQIVIERQNLVATSGDWNRQNWGSTAPYNDGPGPYQAPYQAPYRADVFTTGGFEFGLTSSPDPAFTPRRVPSPPPAPVLPPAPPIVESADAGDRNIIVRGSIRSIE